MPLKKGKTDKILNKNITELMGTYKKSGKIGTSKPKSKKAAQKQAAAIAYSKMDKIASKYVDNRVKSHLSEMYHEDEDYRTGSGHVRLGHGPPIPRVKCECRDCIYWARGNKCVAEQMNLSYSYNDKGQQICECNTYTPDHTEAEEATDEFQDLKGDEDTYGPDQVDDTLIGI